MQLAQLLVEIRRRARVLPAYDVDPMEEIGRRLSEPPTAEQRTLLKFALAIRHNAGGEFNENEIWALGPEALGLLDALIERTIS
jgi:hypothetical protein